MNTVKQSTNIHKTLTTYVPFQKKKKTNPSYPPSHLPLSWPVWPWSNQLPVRAGRLANPYLGGVGAVGGRSRFCSHPVSISLSPSEGACPGSGTTELPITVGAHPLVVLREAPLWFPGASEHSDSQASPRFRASQWQVGPRDLHQTPSPQATLMQGAVDRTLRNTCPSPLPVG